MQSVDQWINLSQASRRFGVPVPTIHLWVSRGMLPSRKGFGTGQGGVTYVDPARLAVLVANRPGQGRAWPKEYLGAFENPSDTP